MRCTKIRFVRTLVFLFSSFLAVVPGVTSADADYTGDTPPVALGAACGPGVAYRWTVETETPWHVSLLVSVPDGFTPSEWSGTDAFVAAFRKRVGNDNDVAAMSTALVTLWPEVSYSPARLYGLFERSVTVETRNVECVGGTWTQSIAGVETRTDSSEWVRVVEDPVYQINTTAQVLEEAVSRLLVKVNSQPEADSRPHHSYTVVTQ